MIKEEFKALPMERKDLRNFGLVMAAALMIIAGFIWWRHGHLFKLLPGVGAAFLVLGLAAPMWLKPLYKGWMAFALVLGFFVTRLLLSVLFFTAVTPIGVLMRLSGKKFLELSFRDENQKTYWIPYVKHHHEGRQKYEVQF